jgi:hypothetical protein
MLHYFFSMPDGRAHAPSLERTGPVIVVEGLRERRGAGAMRQRDPRYGHFGRPQCQNGRSWGIKPELQVRMRERSRHAGASGGQAREPVCATVAVFARPPVAGGGSIRTYVG